MGRTIDPEVDDFMETLDYIGSCSLVSAPFSLV